MEIADVILGYAFYKASFIIEASIRRFLFRFSYDFSDDTIIKRSFETGFLEDAQRYGWYHWLVLEHCISVCKKTPKCDICFLRGDATRTVEIKGLIG